MGGLVDMVDATMPTQPCWLAERIEAPPIGCVNRPALSPGENKRPVLRRGLDRLPAPRWADGVASCRVVAGKAIANVAHLFHLSGQSLGGRRQVDVLSDRLPRRKIFPLRETRHVI